MDKDEIMEYMKNVTDGNSSLVTKEFEDKFYQLINSEDKELKRLGYTLRQDLWERYWDIKVEPFIRHDTET